MTPPTCPTHPETRMVVVTYCPACRGAAGGRASTSKKRAAAKRNAKKPRPRAKPAS